MSKMIPFFVAVFFVFIFSRNVLAASLPQVEPAAAGLDTATLTYIDSVVESAIAAQQMPGCTVCIGRTGHIAFLKSYGLKQLVPEVLKTEENTVYDLASLTKVISTTVCVAVLADRGKIDFDAPVSRYLKEFYTPEKVGITVKQLMLHTAGFVPDLPMSAFRDGVEKSWQNVLNAKPVREPEEDFVYSDVSFQILGKLVERVSRQPLDVFARENVFEPLGMKETAYNPDAELSKRSAATQDRELGKVHDPRAFATDGVAGHAGLFSTAADLAILADEMLRISHSRLNLPPAEKENGHLFRRETFDKMNTAYRVAGGDYRGLGWDKFSGFSSNRGSNMSPQAFGHGGFTGTAIWIDPALDLYVIFLSNRVHPNGKGSVNALAGQIGEIAVDSIVKRSKEERKEDKVLNVKGTEQDGVLPGVDVLEKTKFAVLEGKRVGVITNHTGLTRDGRPVTKILQDAANVKLTAIFTPEHGLTGTLDQANIADGKDPATGVPVFSLHNGKTLRPTPKMLDNADVLVFDIQDIGARFYTYISTLLNSMEAAAFAGKEFVILDRPNPIRGDLAEGPVLQPGLERFVGCALIPLRHGMTVGELALMFNDERQLGLKLTVVPCTGWKRSMDADAVKIPWVNPSPNMRSLTAAYLYPGNGLPEFTNISVGRGTETPFEWVGAPWIEAEKFSAALTANAAAAKLEGVKFERCEFTPSESKYKGEKCFGAKFILENRETFRPVRFGMVLLTTLRQLYPDKWETKNLGSLLLHKKTEQMILQGKPVAEIEADWKPELDRFLKRTERYLLY